MIHGRWVEVEPDHWLNTSNVTHVTVQRWKPGSDDLATAIYHLVGGGLVTIEYGKIEDARAGVVKVVKPF